MLYIGLVGWLVFVYDFSVVYGVYVCVCILNLVHLRGDDNRVRGGQLAGALCAEIVTAGVLLRQTVCGAIAMLTLPTGEVGECEFLGAADAALLMCCGCRLCR